MILVGALSVIVNKLWTVDLRCDVQPVAPCTVTLSLCRCHTGGGLHRSGDTAVTYSKYLLAPAPLTVLCKGYTGTQGANIHGNMSVAPLDQNNKT